MTDFPRGPDELTREWVCKIAGLEVAGETGPAPLEFRRIGAGRGLAGQIVRIMLGGKGREGGCPASLIAKFPPADGASRAIGNALHLYERESRYYEQLADLTPVATPRCYFNGRDVDGDAYLLLLEDLGHGTVGDQLQGWTVDEAGHAVDALAGLHARWWGAVDGDEFSWMPAWNDPALVAAVQHAYHQSWPSFERMFGQDLPDEARRIGARLADTLPSLMEGIAAAPRTLVHGDFRMDNLFFGTGNRVTVIDWQIVCRGRGTFDLAYFLVQSGAIEQRRTHESGLIRRYVASLAAAGVTGYGLEECLADFRRSVLYGLVYAVISGGGMDLGDARGIELIRSVSRRAGAAVMDHGCSELL